MFPIRDHNPSGRTPFVTYALMAANIGIFLAYFPFLQGTQLARFYYDWALIPAAISDGNGYFGMISSMFLHGGWMHLAGNMLFLWIFGDNMEDEMGHGGFLIFYLVAGIGAGLTQVISAPYSQVPVVGASGAIAGVMGGYLLLFPKARIDILLFLIIFIRIFTVPAWIMLGLWFLFQLGNGVAADQGGGGVAYWAHAGGFIVGAILTVPVWLKRGAFKFWNRTEGHPPHPETKYQLSQSSVPSIRRRR